MDTPVCVWIPVFVYGYTDLCMDTRVCVWIHLFVYGYTCLCMDTHICVCIHLFVYGYMCLCMDTHVCECIHMFVYGYTCALRLDQLGLLSFVWCLYVDHRSRRLFYLPNPGLAPAPFWTEDAQGLFTYKIVNPDKDALGVSDHDPLASLDRSGKMPSSFYLAPEKTVSWSTPNTPDARGYM